jgi:hypothetical protein
MCIPRKFIGAVEDEWQLYRLVILFMNVLAVL